VGRVNAKTRTRIVSAALVFLLAAVAVAAAFG
jgi:hypothetical protein